MTVQTCSTQGSTPICRSISLDLIDTDAWDLKDNVVAEPIPTGQINVADFIQEILPGHQVEHLGRKNMVAFQERIDSPSSLFFQAVHSCFCNHYPLALRPEILMFLITHEVATMVKMHPEAYRHLFTKSVNKERIDIRHDGLERGNPDSPWDEALALFSGPLAEAVPSNLMRYFLPDLTTDTAESKLASLVCFMEAASPFYNYHTWTRCGIPEIRLLGVAEDYQRVLQSAQSLSEYFSDHLGLYFQHLIPVLKKIVEQANGAPLDEDFWSSIYKYESASGTDHFNGWLTAFVNYVQVQKDRDCLELKQKSDDLFDWHRMHEDNGWCIPGLDVGSVPSHVSQAPFTWHYYNKELPMIFLGGVLGVDNEDGYATPTLSYGVVNKP